MKRIVKRLLRILSLALALTLAAVLFPYAKDWLSRYLPQGKYDRATMVISHEMEKAGELTAVRYTDQELMEASTKALLLGEVQKVTAPYTYEIGLGIRLSDVQLSSNQDGITIRVPEIEMLYDSFRVTGSPEVQDFFYKLNESRYQQMLNDQAAECRAKYLADENCLQEAWQAACESLEKMIQQWTGEKLPLKFIRTAST